MFGSFNKKPDEPSDEEIKKKIDEMEREHYQKEHLEIESEFTDEVEAIKQEMEEAGRIINYVEGYMIENPSKTDENMPLGEFMDFIEEDGNFDAVVSGLIDVWTERFPGKINLEKPVKSFLDFVAEKGEEASHLLNPKHGKTKAE